MNTKQFVGTSIDEVLRDIRAELGDEAVILQTRKVVKGGLGGFFGKELIEVTAADSLDDGAVATATAAPSIDITDEEPAPPRFARQLDRRMGAAPDPSVAPAPASPASAYARATNPAAAPATAPAAVAPAFEPVSELSRPFPAANQDRTRAIIEAARAAMRTSDEAADPAPSAIPAPPSFMPAGRGAAEATPEPSGRPQLSLPTWTRLEDSPAVPTLSRAAAPAAPTAPAAPAAAVASAAPTPPAAVPMPDLSVPMPPPQPVAAAPVVAVPVPEPAPVHTVTVPQPLEPVGSVADLVDEASGVPATPTASALPPLPEVPGQVAAAPVAPAPVAPPAPAPVAAAPAVEVPQPVTPPTAVEDGQYAAIAPVREELIAAGVDPRYLGPFLDGFVRNSMPFIPAGADLRQAIRAALAARIPVSRDWKGRPKGQALAFVGQSGVGKSTVLRKLAWKMHQAGNVVAVICAGETVDPHVASMAERMGLSFRHAPDAEALANARASVGDEVDIVLIDTPGCSHTNLEEMEELGRLLGQSRIEEVHLVLPVAIPLGDLGDLSRRFRIAGVNRLTLTKLDETRLLGNLVNVPLRLSKPLAFLADGTSATAHLAPANPNDVVDVLLP